MGDNSREPDRLPILRWWVAAAAATVILLLTAGSLVWLLLVAGGNDPDRANARIDAIRTGLSVGAGLAALSGLLLAFRRQRSNEQAAADANHDATERRITELYTAAAEHLGSDKAPVRMAGLYALERLAQANPDHQQTIVDVICAYLRMPFTPPPDPTGEPGQGAGSGNPDQREELEVRRTAQDILADHLHPDFDDDPSPRFWPGICLNLARATLVSFSLTGCGVDAADFTGTTFVGSAFFFLAKFNGYARFDRATFRDSATFFEATFAGSFTSFERATFIAGADFAWATFSSRIDFTAATFAEPVNLSEASAVNHAGSFWPDGWRVVADPEGGLGRFVREDDSAAQVGEDGQDPPVVGG